MVWDGIASRRIWTFSHGMYPGLKMYLGNWTNIGYSMGNNGSRRLEIRFVAVQLFCKASPP